MARVQKRFNLAFPRTVGEEDEVSIREAAEAVIDAMDFRGEVTVSLATVWGEGMMEEQ